MTMNNNPVLYLGGVLDGQYINQSEDVGGGLCSFRDLSDPFSKKLVAHTYAPYFCERKIDDEITEYFQVMVCADVPEHEVSDLIKARLGAKSID